MYMQALKRGSSFKHVEFTTVSISTTLRILSLYSPPVCLGSSDWTGPLFLASSHLIGLCRGAGGLYVCASRLTGEMPVIAWVGLSRIIWPSFLSQFSALVAGHKIPWILRDNILTCHHETMKNLSIKVISEELAYNSRLKQYRMFVVDHPLVTGLKARNPDKQSGALATREELLTRSRTLDQHKDMLGLFDRHREVGAALSCDC